MYAQTRMTANVFSAATAGVTNTLPSAPEVSSRGVVLLILDLT